MEQWVEPVAMEAAEEEEEEQSYHLSAGAVVVSCQWRNQRWVGQQEELWRI